jgi:hypothetical protein
MTDPNHKAEFSFGVKCNCSCGWSSSTWYGKGSKRSASAEWHNHKMKCEKKEANNG